jgi:choline transporter-like protein 2/4/5
VSPDCYTSYDWDARLTRAFVLHLFGLLWANQFIAGFTGTVVAGAVASFYWARGDRSRCVFAFLVGGVSF